MGCTSRERQIRTCRRPRSASRLEFPLETRKDHNFSLQKALLNRDNLPSSSKDEENTWDYCSENQLEEILMNNLEFLYKEAVTKLVELGYQEDAARQAILTNGHGYYGGMDALTNILQNAIAHLKGKDTGNDTGQAFTTFRQLEDYSLAGMICMLQQAKPNLSRGEAMWCLLMSDLHVGRASSMETQNDTEKNDESGTSPQTHKPATESNPEHKFDISSPFTTLLQRNVALFTAELHANSQNLETQTTEEPSTEETQEINAMLGKLKELNLDNDVEGKNTYITRSLVIQVKELEKQLIDRKAWAQEKAIQAAKKLSCDLVDLKILRMEADESVRIKKGKQTPEDRSTGQLSDIENLLRQRSKQFDQENAAIRRLETENAEIRAEIEASKLSASESSSTCVEVAKREKKWAKKLATWDKQKAKMEDEIERERAEIRAMNLALEDLDRQGKEAVSKWKEESDRRKELMAEVEAERRRKVAAEVANKQKVEAMRVMMEIKLEKYKDDVERLEQEIGRLRTLESRDHTLRGGPARTPPPEAIETCDRYCLLCGDNDVSVVFLPCAHQVLCVQCGVGFGPGGPGGPGTGLNSLCPCCNSVIESKIRVFGARP